MENTTAMNSIIYVARHHLRYNVGGLLLSFEDLWTLDPVLLNDKYVKMVASLEKVKASVDISLEPTEARRNAEELQHMIDALLYVYETKSAELKEKLAEEEKRKQKKRIMEIIARKEQSELENKSVEELKAMLEE